MKKKLTLSTQFNLLIAITTTIIVTIMIILSGILTASNVNGELTDQCITGTNLLEYEMAIHNPGEDGDMTEMLDRLKQITGCEFTIFNGNVREYSTIIIDGERVIGTSLDAGIANIVLEQGKDYVGEADILGERHITSYIPLKNDAGEITGVLFAGLLSSSNDAATSRSLTISMFVGIALILVICIIAKIMVDRSVARPLKIVTDAAQSIAQGEMAIQLDVVSNNEIGLLADSFNAMKENLSSLNAILVEMMARIAQGDWNVDIGSAETYKGDWKELYASLDKMTKSVKGALSQVSTSAVQISSNITQVSNGAQALAEGAVDQASSIDRLSTNLQEISLQIDDNFKNTKKVNDIAVISGEVTETTLSDMQQMLEAMQEISGTSENIVKVIKVIDDIAFQTNILALNAAVEAARAGEAGKGFAVVADEVRSLAQKSSEAANNTTQLIEHSIEAVKLGEGIAQKTNGSFKDLAEKVQQMVVTIDEIASATEEQADGIKAISSGIEQISAVVQTNTATSEESAAVSEELSKQANALHLLVDKFKL